MTCPITGCPRAAARVQPGVRTQKFNFSENCIDRLSTTVDVIRPAVGESKFWFGKPKPGWLNRLNASHRNSTLVRPMSGEALRQRRVEVDVARAVEDAAAAVAVGVGRRRDEVARVVPQIDRRVVQLARPDAVRPARRAVVDAGLHEDGERPAGGDRPDAGELPAADDRAEHAALVQPAAARSPRQLPDAADDRAMPHVEAGRPVARIEVGDRLRVADRAAAARRRPAVVERLAVGVAAEELQRRR